MSIQIHVADIAFMRDDDENPKAPNDNSEGSGVSRRDFLKISGISVAVPLVAGPRTTGMKHPSPLSLAQTDSRPSTPTVFKDDQDHWISSATTKLNSGEELPFALVVKGTAEQ